MAAIFLSAFLISQKDEASGGYAGLNYHFITYVIVNTISLISSDTNTALFTMGVWGIGLLFHWMTYLFIFRKKRIGKYEKEDVFK